MAKHIEFMKTIITQPIYSLKKDMVASKGGKKSSGLTDMVDCFIKDIADERIKLGGAEFKIKRLFGQAPDSGEYSGVGWVVNSEIAYCMVCSTAFGMFTYQHHCKACGNIVCNTCSSNQALIFEIQNLGPKRVCTQCFWGQEIVDAVIKLEPVFTKPVVSPTLNDVRLKEQPKEVIVEETPEEIERRIKIQQQEAFQKEALNRMIGGQLLNKKQSVIDTSYQENVNNDYDDSNNANSIDNSNNSPVPAGGGNVDDDDTAHIDRVKKLASFGPLTYVIPTPAFVLKTKRTDMTKVFVNVTTHANVPYKQDDTTLGYYDINKLVYMLVAPPVEHMNEKDGEYCIIYDIVVHPDEVYISSVDSTSAVRNRLCNQSLELIALHFMEHLDPSYKILRISGNYKGKNEAKGKPNAVVIPDKEAFYNLIQITTSPADMDIWESIKNGGSGSAGGAVGGNNRSGSVVSVANTYGNNRSGSVVSGVNSGVNPSRQASMVMYDNPAATNRNSGLKTPTNSNKMTSPTRENSIIKPNNDRSSIASMSDESFRATTINLEDSVHSNFDSAIKVTVKPSNLAAKITNNNFNIVLKDLEQYQYNIKDIVLTPESGFVIAAQRINRGQQIFINVCHHPLVGFVTVRATGGTAPEGYQSPCPFIVGQIDNDFETKDPLLAPPTGSSSGKKSIVMNIVIPSSVLLAIIADTSGDLRDTLAIEILEALSELNIQFENNFSLPLIPGGYVGKSNVIAPVINLTEVEKKQYVISFVGKMYKQGHGVKTWKQRLVHIVENKLKYFDLNSAYKGDFTIEDCNVSYIPNSECKAPDNTYPFKLANYVSGGEFMYCYVSTSELRELFSLVISCKTRQMSILKDLINIPELTTGWLKKQGHRIKNWKRRFFILNYGILKYYEKNGQEGSGTGETELGSVMLKGATVKVIVNTDGGGKNSDKDHRFQVIDNASKELLLQAETASEKNEWFDAIKRHILYANQYT